MEDIDKDKKNILKGREIDRDQKDKTQTKTTKKNKNQTETKKNILKRARNRQRLVVQDIN